jgi:hypothetical protein
LRNPLTGRVGGEAQDVYPPRADLDHERHADAGQQHGVDVETSHANSPAAWQRSNSRQVTLSPRGAGPRPASDRIRRIVPLAQPVLTTEQLALNPPIPPARVFPREAGHDLANRCCCVGTVRSVAAKLNQ